MGGRQHEQIPTDVYLSFVRSLYGNRMTLRAGMISHVLTCGLIYFKVQDPVYLAFGGIIFALWFIRAMSMRWFDKVEFADTDRDLISKWEWRYIAGSGLVTLTLGLMNGYAFLVSQDTFAQLAALSVTIGTMVSVVGRNFGSKTNVDIISLAACLPIMIGLLFAGSIYMAILGFMVIPLIVTTRAMANGVREFLYENVLSRREIAIIADRFNAALNNMPHGLFMLDEDGRIVVANKKAAELLSAPERDSLRNHSLMAVLRYGVRRGVITSGRAKIIERQLKSLIAGEESRALVYFSEELYLEFSAKRRMGNGVVLIFEDVTARIKAEEKIVHMARYDSLTGLSNRGYFSEIVETAVRNMGDDEKFALAVIDLDDFKHVNDTNGHMTGDRLLCAISARLSGLANERMTLSRFGGDEFVIFIRDVRDAADVDKTMSELFESLRGNYLINGNKLFVSLSAGVVIGSKAEFRLDDLQIKADLALYETKHHDKNSWVIFAEEMDEKYTRRQKLKAALRDAVREKSFTVVYQPMFTADTVQVVCCEALSRWYHPEFGAVSPAVYIPLAEEMGIVGELTRHMLTVACRDCASWPNGSAVSVNLSANDLRNKEIVSMVTDALDAAGLDAKQLQVEVTESAFVQDAAKAKSILEELRAKGVTVAIDDFGTGYSSLSYLHLLPLNKVKIDRSFVSDIANDERTLKLLKGVVHLSRELGLEIVVEGVETEEQLELIRSTGSADLIQGFIFGMPMPSSGIVELTSSRKPKAARAAAPKTKRAGTGG
ncbi:putative bifunctional diguanylate cyclase/phosphodiesterase [Hoeflea poritis]|uniref:EAL domain-containing protein n=1 Tax=Hoeflea poritis TaxID=2993659 RepID=A0ABT4VR44_9HYPH|nr:EAL domain-containing protein [Hoeflea poritis]MDA4847187.1 EAL domain-containing protein [Hoeflea poritis]